MAQNIRSTQNGRIISRFLFRFFVLFSVPDLGLAISAKINLSPTSVVTSSLRNAILAADSDYVNGSKTPVVRVGF